MYEINRTDEFEEWFKAIRDPLTQGRLLARLRKVALGSLGDVAPLSNSDGIWEMREHFGAGWRMYYILCKKQVVILLGGGIKSTQVSDIKRMKKILLTMED